MDKGTILQRIDTCEYAIVTELLHNIKAIHIVVITNGTCYRVGDSRFISENMVATSDQEIGELTIWRVICN
jgi:hypothetical protein